MSGADVQAVLDALGRLEARLEGVEANLVLVQQACSQQGQQIALLMDRMAAERRAARPTPPPGE